MKRTLIIAALVSSTAVAGQAATELQRNELQQFLPNVDVSTLSDSRVDSLVGVMHGGGSRSEREATMRGLVADDNPVTMDARGATVSELRTFAPDVDFSRFTDAELAQATSILHGSGSASERRATLRSFELSDRAITTDPLTDAEVSTIRSYAPGIDLTTLSDEEVLRIQTAISGGDTNEIQTVISSITES